jgi:hypothetical protein
MPQVPLANWHAHAREGDPSCVPLKHADFLGSSFLVAGCPPLLRGVLCIVQAPRLSMCSSPRGATGGGGPQPAAALTMQTRTEFKLSSHLM